ncbi:peptidase [Pseudarthrobacter sulfonivorans]|uniref:peptidase n=1 Tax=Pseudarthrobacter sulfonivorans TaxID=121292 RepID=UPI0021068BFA|nr:peptidase [Pseudarthrobacter sulfonivorans]
MALALALGIVPAAAATGGDDSTVSPSQAGPSEAGLSEALLRDLGLSLTEFNAAGEVGRRAADALNTLQALPGFVGVSLKNGEILVHGTGPALQAKVDELNQSGPEVFVLAAPSPLGTPAQPSPGPDATAAPAPSPTASNSSMLGSSAVDPSAPELVAQNIDQLFQAYVHEVGTRGLQAVAYTDGHFVIRTGPGNTSESDVPGAVSEQPSLPASAPEPTLAAEPASSPRPAAAGKLTPEQFVSRYANVQLETGAAVKTEDDIFGGQGFFVDNMIRCSTGFSAFGPTGLPLVLTAGHCTGDGTAKAAGLEPLGWAPAGGSSAVTPWPMPALAPLGNFGFSQFGGPNNAAATDGSSVGTDIAVIKDIAAGLDLQPAASTWGDAKTPDPVKIVGAAAPVQGEPVCRSGRTTGWKCGTIDSIAIVMMPGSKATPPDYDNDPRPVRAFDSSSVASAGGDSGGPWISGNYAVGTHTGAEILDGVQKRAIAATLVDSLASIPGGVQLELFLNKPTVTKPAPGSTFDAGATISGQVAAAPASAVAAGSKVRVTLAGEDPIEVPVDPAGGWSFTAPGVPRPLRFTAETVNGFSKSGATAFEFDPAPAAPPVVAPVVPPAVTPDGPAAGAPAPSATPAPAATTAVVPAAGGAPVPAGDAAVVVRPLGEPAQLASTGASGLLPAAGLAAGALVVGGVLLILLRRRRRQRPTRTVQR